MLTYEAKATLTAFAVLALFGAGLAVTVLCALWVVP